MILDVASEIVNKFFQWGIGHISPEFHVLKPSRCHFDVSLVTVNFSVRAKLRRALPRAEMGMAVVTLTKFFPCSWAFDTNK